MGMKYPYREAQLVIPNPSSKRQRWRIVFYATDIHENKLKRKILEGINAIPLKDRYKAAMELIEEINRRLRNGEVLIRTKQDQEKELIKKRQVTVKKALKLALETKKELINPDRLYKKKNSYIFYKSIVNQFIKWLEYEQIQNTPLIHFNSHLAKLYAKTLDQDPNKSNYTFNHHRATLINMFNVLKREEYIEKNPFENIPSKKKKPSKVYPYTSDMMAEIMQFMNQKYPEMIFPVKFIYYTLMRPSEMMHLRIRDIGLYHPDQIYLDGSYSKNGQSRHVQIHDDLRAEFERMNLKKYPDDFFIFSDNFKPGRKFRSPGYMGSQFRRRVRDPECLFCWCVKGGYSDPSRAYQQS